MSSHDDIDRNPQTAQIGDESIARGSLAVFVFVLVAGCGVVAPPAAPAAPAAQAPAPAPKAAERVAPKASEPSKAAAPAKAAPKAAAPAAPATAPPPVAARPAAAPLDLRSLEQRLKDTDAIGVLTKLSLKNQVDDLIAHFRAFHEGQRPPTLSQLRPAFELLLMKVLSLLQDHDTKLANDINASREAIWGVLTDRDKLAQYL